MENTNFKDLKVYIEEGKTQDYGKLYLEPLERGYGDTIGNALRRLLLSSIKGAAVTAVRIDGVLHEFSTIKGIREDVIEILMNLKHIPIKAKTAQAHLNEEGFKIITLDSDDLPKDFFTREVNPGVITAKDMPWDNDFEFCGDGVLCTLEQGAHLLMEIYVEQGVGYLSAERERPSQPSLPVDALLTDAIFSPVKRVNYQIEPARVGQNIDFEQLMVEVWTNGAISPEEAVGQASRIAESYFGYIADIVKTAPKHKKTISDPDPEPEIPAQPGRDRPIHELELSIRSENCLLRGGIQTIGDLLDKSRDDLLKIRNLGKISLTEILEKLTKLGFELNTANTSDEAAKDKDTNETADVVAEDFSSSETPEELVEEINNETKIPNSNNVEETAKPESELTESTEKTEMTENAEKPKPKRASRAKKSAKPKEEKPEEATSEEAKPEETKPKKAKTKETKTKEAKPKKAKTKETKPRKAKSAPKAEAEEIKNENNDEIKE